MTYAEEREYTAGQRRVVVLEHLRSVGPLSATEAARLVGCQMRQAHNILLDIEGVVRLGKEGVRWRYLGQHSDEDNLGYGR